ncbi:tubulin epsilon and delta complex protein 2 isoform X1 [Pogoniulus pusillus]|uniref:tubulin epsilon and delta complex protein 2 isoform X1 n=1 Tax=Pogoniulus pusillus TaxID=488313 RepID=UPI0030B921BD
MRPVLPAPLPPCPSAPSSAGPGRTTSNAAVSAVFRAAPYSGQDPAGPGRRGSCGLRAAGGGESGEAAAALGGPAARGKSLTALSLCRGSEDEEHRQPELDSSNVHENKASAEELEELELLNRALEKALKVRRSILKTSVEGQGAGGEKFVAEGPAANNAKEQQVPVPLGDVPENAEVKAVSKKPASWKKPAPYQLRAPYRTDPDVKKVVQRKAPGRCASQGPKRAGSNCPKGVVCKQGRGHRRAKSASSRGPCAPAEPQKTPGLNRASLTQQQSFSARASAGGKSSTAASKQGYGSGQTSCGFLGDSSRKEEPTAEGSLGKSSSPQAVTEQEKRCWLQLPLPYRKAYSRNSRVWQSCCLCQSNVDAAAARSHFLERIQSTFCSVPTFSPAEIEEELKALQDVPSLLSHYVGVEPAAHATLPGEYESLLSLEGLLATASQCLHKLQLLRAAVESQAKLCPGCSGDMGSCSPACAPARGQMCGPADVLPVPLLCYYSSQELKDLFALKLQVSVLHQEVALQKVLMVEVLPALESRLCLEASLAQLYRAIYSHLCQGGRRFLVLVRDELAE